MVNTMKFVSMLLIAIVLSGSEGAADEHQTLDSVKGKEITPELTETLPNRDCSTPQKAFLGFLRSNAQGNLKDYLFYLTPRAKKDIAGVEDEDTISDDKARDFEKAFKKAGFRKFRLESFQAIPDISPTQIVAVVTSLRGKMEMRDRYEIAVIQTNGLWKFSSVSISPVERKQTDE